MINTITDDYSRWLNRYIKQKTCRHKSVAEQLVTALTKVRSVEEIQSIHSTKEPATHSAFFDSKNSTDIFIIKFQRFMNTISELKKMHNP